MFTRMRNAATFTLILVLLVLSMLPRKSEVSQAAAVPSCPEVWPPTEIKVFVPEYGQEASATVCIYKSDPAGHMDWPVIILDGIDLRNERHWSELYGMFSYSHPAPYVPHVSPAPPVSANLLEDGRLYGFDYVVVDWSGGADYIQKNARLLEMIIEKVNSRKSGEHPNIVIGPSMGGVIARYALASMEKRGIRHDTWLYVSWDAPHQGANVPISLQMAADYVADYLGEYGKEARALRDLLDLPAARQMLLLHYDVNAARERNAFVAALQSMGYPKLTRNIAFTNGSGIGLSQGFAPGDWLLTWHNGGNWFYIRMDLYAVGAADQKVFWTHDTHISHGPSTPDRVDLRKAPPFDSAPGGGGRFITEVKGAVSGALRGGIKEAVLRGVLGEPQLNPKVVRESHIPTISALDLAVTDLFTDVSELESTGRLYSLTPFDGVYYPRENQPHVAVTEQNGAWIIREMLSGGAICNRVTQIPKQECEALAALWRSTDGWNWTGDGVQRNWMQTTSPCSSGGPRGLIGWFGVACENGHVTALYLAGHNLTGSIPPEITNLTQLRILHLYNNNLGGQIPKDLGQLPLESLMLHSNRLSGNIPESFRFLTRIDPTRSSLDWNRLTVDKTSAYAQDLIKLLNQKFPTWEARQSK